MPVIAMSDSVQEIKEKLDIVEIIREYIPLIPAGKNLKANCPFHKEKTPSFVVSPERQTWHCFGSCNEGGDVFSFVMKYNHVEFYEALKMLAERAGVELKSVNPASQKEFGVLYDINASARDYFKEQLLQSERAQAYTRERGLMPHTLEEFGVGFAPNASDGLLVHLVNAGYDASDIERAGLVFKTERGTYMDRFRGRIMFPLHNTFGKVVAFSGRILPEFDTGQAGKYVNSPETLIFNKSKLLYGFHKTKQHIREAQNALLVEGQMDFLMLYQDGVCNVVGVSGTALTPHHLQALRKVADTVTLAFDNDEAGVAAIERGIDMAHAMDFSVKTFSLSDAKDAAEFILRNPGVIASRIITDARDALSFYFSRYSELPTQSIKDKARALLRKVLHLGSPIEQNIWLKTISEKLNIAERALYEELQLLKKPIIQKNESVSQSSPSQEEMFVPKTRHEHLSERILLLALSDGTQMKQVEEYISYFPTSGAHALSVLLGGEHADPQIVSYARSLEMRSSLGHNVVATEKLDAEITFLLKELKKEFFLQRRLELLARIKDSERAHDDAHTQKLLAEFDELAQLIDT